eukprot:Sspe_Gene.28908::Locus_13368_Transcript_2_6_Confidence_0.500_Length_665::g.28908::m.28908/K13279/PRDX1; peroxiredoxin 1
MSKAIVQHAPPAFKAQALMPDGSFKEVSLADYTGKYLVAVLLPALDFTFVCPTEITAFSDRYEEFKKIGCEVVACSVDSQFSHLAWTKQDRKNGGLGKMEIPILADITKQIAWTTGAGSRRGRAGCCAAGAVRVIDKKVCCGHITMNDLPVGRGTWTRCCGWCRPSSTTTRRGRLCRAGGSRGRRP